MMWPFNPIAKPDDPASPAPVLKVFIGATEVCAVNRAEIPAEKRPLGALRRRDDAIAFIDSKGGIRKFDISSAFDDGARFLHLSVRVGPAFTVQADAILTAQKDDDPQQAYKDGANAIRFQPFFLPESTVDGSDLAGRGLFYRGLHFSGTVTPGNVSLMCLCDHCRNSFRLQSFHAGLSSVCYFYCSGGPHTLTASSYEPDAPPLLQKGDVEATARFENRLPRSIECDGTFKYDNPLVCPHCRKPYIDFASHPDERQREYYGNYLYGGSIQQSPAPPTE